MVPAAAMPVGTSSEVFEDGISRFQRRCILLVCWSSVRSNENWIHRQTKASHHDKNSCRRSSFLHRCHGLGPAVWPSIYDLVLKQGRVIDPGSNRFGRYDIAINGNRIARIARWVPAAHARLAVDAGEYYVTPGLIDVNADVNFLGSPGGVQPDQRSLPYGVTTVADPNATQVVIRRSRTQVLPVAVQLQVEGLLASGMNRQTCSPDKRA